MSSAHVKEIQVPRIYLDAVTSKVRVRLAGEIRPKKCPSPHLARQLHVPSYTFNSITRELHHAPRYGYSGSTNGARLFRVSENRDYKGSNRKTARAGIRNQLTVDEKRTLVELLDGSEHPCDYQLELLFQLLGNLEADMGPGEIRSRSLFKLEFYFEIAFGGDPEIIRQRLQSAISKLAGTMVEVRSNPKDNTQGVRDYWEIPIKLCEKDRRVQIKVYRKGDFVRVESVFNKPGIIDDPGDRSRFRAGVREVRNQAVSVLTALYSEVSGVDPCRSEGDIAALIKYVMIFPQKSGHENQLASANLSYSSGLM